MMLAVGVHIWPFFFLEECIVVLINGVATLYVEKILACVTCFFFVLIGVMYIFLFYIDIIITSMCCSLLNHVPDINCIWLQHLITQ